MSDTFLWMPRPNTIVAHGGKPVIDCNPQIGSVVIEASISTSIEYDTYAPIECIPIISPESLAQDVLSEIFVYPSDLKITGASGGDILDIRKSDHSIYARSNTPMPSSPGTYTYTTAARLSIDAAVLPCYDDGRLDLLMQSTEPVLTMHCNDSGNEFDYDAPSTSTCFASISITNASKFGVDIEMTVSSSCDTYPTQKFHIDSEDSYEPFRFGDICYHPNFWATISIKQPI